MLTVSVVCVVTGQPSAMPGGETTDDGGQDQHAQHPQARAQDQGDHHQEPGQAHYQEEGAIITVGVFAGRATAGCFTASLAGQQQDVSQHHWQGNSRMFHSITGRATAGCFTASLAGYSRMFHSITGRLQPQQELLSR